MLIQNMTKEEIWLRAWLAVSSSSNIKEVSIATFWADKCLEDFIKRFRMARQENKE